MALLCGAPGDAYGVAEHQPAVTLPAGIDPRHSLGAIDLDPSSPGSDEAIHRRQMRFLARVVTGWWRIRLGTLRSGRR